MRKTITVLFGSLFFLSFLSCSSTSPATKTKASPRTIILDGVTTLTDSTTGGFTSWVCGDYIRDDGNIQVEVGFFGDSILKGTGFILFDGGDTGESTYHQRNGLEQRWDWGPNAGSVYSFVIKTDGTGLYYDFTTVETGESTTAKAVYRCRKR